MLIIKNYTSSDIVLTDIEDGITIPGDGEYNVTDNNIEYKAIAKSEQLASNLALNELNFNLGEGDLAIHETLLYLQSLRQIANPFDRSGKLRVQQTSRQIGLISYWTGAGDDSSDWTDKGGGESTAFSHTIGDATTQTKYIDFNIADNESWLHEGYMEWYGCTNDTLTLEMVARATSLTGGTDTNFNLYGGYLVIPAAGNGTYALVNDMSDPNDGLIYIPKNDLGVRGAAYWNADFNSTTGLYENLTPAYAADGHYNMFAAEIPLAKFHNRIPLLHNGFMPLNSSDTDEMGNGMRLKLTYDTIGDDHDWSCNVTIMMHREKLI